MQSQLREIVLPYLRAELLKSRAAMGCSQEEMAHILHISCRAYSALESGKSCFGLITLLLFLRYCCNDRQAFLDGLFRLFDQLEDAA